MLVACVGDGSDDPPQVMHGSVGTWTGDSQPMLEAVGIWTGGAPTAPGAPAGCKAKVSVTVPYSLCEDPALAEHIDLPKQRAMNERRADLNGASPVTPYLATPVGEGAEQFACSLMCDSGSKSARWHFRIEAEGARGHLTCSVGEVVGQEVDIVDSGAPVPDGVGVMWLTDLSHFSFSGSPQSFETGEGMKLIGDNLCPAGQPSRDGGVVGALPQDS